MVPKTREVEFGPHRFRIAQTADGWKGIVVGGCGTQFAGDDAREVVRKLQDHVLKSMPEFFGFDGARTRFLSLFAGGFTDPDLAGSPNSEIGAKRSLIRWVDEKCPLDGALHGDIRPAEIFAAFRKSSMIDYRNMLSLKAALEGPKGARLVEVFSRFATDDIDWACREFSRGFSDEGIRNWSILTHMAFFWRPDRHAFMRPTAARAFARAVGHRFDMDYSSEPEPTTYALYLDLLDATRSHISDLEPRDYIDLQSFVWVVTKYSKPDQDISERP
jgi:hypothetical protein